MTRIAGRLINVGIGKETVRGTSVAPTYWLPNTELDFDDVINKVLNVSSLGVIDKNQNAHITQQSGSGSIKGVVYRNSIGLILANIAGQTSTDTTVETSAKKHVFTVLSANTGLSTTLAKKEPNLGLRFAMAVLDELTIDYVTNNYVMYSAKFISQASASASDTPSYVTETEFIPKHTVIKNAATGISNLGAASALTNIKSLSLTIKKNVKGTDALGNVGLENVVNTDLEITGKIERYYDDTTFKGYWQNNTHRALRLDLIDTDTTVGAVTNPSLRFDFDEVVFTSWKEKMGDSDIVTEELEFTAIRNATSGKTISTIELVNDVASY